MKGTAKIGCLGLLLAAHAAAQDVSFDEHAIEAPFPIEEVLTGRFADAPSLVLLGGQNGAGEFALYALGDGGWRSVHQAALPAGTALADGMSIGGEDRLVIVGGTRLSWLDPADWRFKPLDIGLASTLYRGKPRGVVVADLARDVNGDGTDDVVLPDFDGIWIALQDDAGNFAEPIKLPVAPTMQAGSGVSFSVPTMHPLDYDGDGRGDLAVLDEDRLLVFKDATALAESATIAVPGGLTGSSSARPIGSDAPTRTLRSLADHNGDGVVDLTISTAKGAGPMEAETATHFHFGRREGAATVFDAEPNSTVETGSIGNIEMVDIDGDGREDIVALAGEFSVGKIAMALMTGSISLDAAIYLMGDDGFDDEPAATRKMKLGENSPGPTFADVNGDGRQDMVQITDDGLELALGEPTERLFPKRPFKVETGQPFGDEAPTRSDAEDLNQDGKDDLLLHYAPTTGVLVLLSR